MNSMSYLLRYHTIIRMEISHFYVLLIRIWICTGPIQATTTFLMGFLENYGYNNNNPVGRIYVFNPGPGSATVTMTTPLMSMTTTLTVSSGQRGYQPISNSYHGSGSKIENKGILITSSAPVTVQAFSRGLYSADAFSVPPTTDLGFVHVVATYKYTGSSTNQLPNEILIVASESSTVVNVLLKGPFPLTVTFEGSTYNTDDTIVINLDQYQSAQIQCTYPNGGDFTGTLVTSNKRVYVSSGAKFVSVGIFHYQDYLAETILPVDRFGTDYVFASIMTRSIGDIVRIIGLADGTIFSVYDSDGSTLVSTHSLNTHDFHEVDIPSGKAYHVSADKPIMVVQLPKGNGGGLQFDPFLLNHEPTSRFLTSDSSFGPMTYSSGSYDNHLQVTIATADKAGLQLDGSAITCTGWIDLSTTPYSVCHRSLSSGLHRLVHTSGKVFSAMFYGQRLYETYGVRAMPTPGTYTWTSTARTLDEAVQQRITTVAETTTMPEPTTTMPEPTTTMPEPTTTMPEPTTTMPEPTTTMAVRTTTELESTTTESDPTIAESVPTTAATEQTTSGPKPTASIADSTSTKKHPTSSVPEPNTSELISNTTGYSLTITDGTPLGTPDPKAQTTESSFDMERVSPTINPSDISTISISNTPYLDTITSQLIVEAWFQVSTQFFLVIETHQVNHSEASALCHSKGGHLARVASLEVAERLEARMSDNGRSYWLEAIAQDDEYVNMDSSSIGWYGIHGSVTSSGTSQRCLSLNSSLSLRGEDCSKHLNVICQREYAVILGEWTMWTACTRHCGLEGRRFRIKICSAPDISLKCSKVLKTYTNVSIGYGVDAAQCKLTPCVVDGDWSPWGAWSTCLADCGTGVTSRIRVCVGVANGGVTCKGRSRESMICETGIVCKGYRLPKESGSIVVVKETVTLVTVGSQIFLLLAVFICFVICDVSTYYSNFKWGMENVRSFCHRNNRVKQK